MESEALYIIASNVIGWTALGGIAWNRLSQVEDQLEHNNNLLIKQNSRIDKLEEWRANRRGFTEGYERAKDKYKDGHGPQPGLQG